MGATEAVRAPERDPTELAAPPVPEGGGHTDELGHTRRLLWVSSEDCNIPLWPQCPHLHLGGAAVWGPLPLGQTPGALPSVQSLAQAWADGASPQR